MKINPNLIHQLSALIGYASLKSLEQPRNWLLRCCVICGLILLPPSALATDYPTTKTVAEGAFTGTAGDTFTAASGYGIRIGESGTVSLTDVQIAFDRTTVGGDAIYQDGAQSVLNMTGGGIILTGSGVNSQISGVSVVGNPTNFSNPGSTADLLNVEIKLTQDDAIRGGNGVLAYGNSIVTVTGGTIAITANNKLWDDGGWYNHSMALAASVGGELTADGVTITMAGIRAFGVSANSLNASKTAVLDIKNSSITVNSDLGGGVIASTTGVVNIDDSPVTVSGSGASGIFVETGGVVNATQPMIEVTGENSHGISLSRVYGTYGEPMVNVWGGVISSEGAAIAVEDSYETGSLNAASGGTVNLGGGTVIKSDGLIKSITTGTGVSNLTVKIEEVDLSAAGGIVTQNANPNSHTDVTLIGGSGIIGDVTNNGDGTLNLGLNDSSVTGNINNNNGTVSSTGTSAITGNVNGSLEVSSGTLTVTGSVTVDSGQSVTGNGTLNVGGLEINDGGTLGGGLTIGIDSATRVLVGLSGVTLYHEFGSLTEIGADTLKLGDNLALDLSGIDNLSDFKFAFTDEVQDGNFTLILGKAESLENWNAEISGSISGLTLSGQNEVTADITITLNGDNSALTATLSNVTVNAVPEPSTYFLLGTGLGLLLLTARYRRKVGTDA